MRIQISEKGVQIYKGDGVCFTDFISFYLNISRKWNNLVSLRANYFIFHGIFENGGGGGGAPREWGSTEPPLDPPLQKELLVPILRLVLLSNVEKINRLCTNWISYKVWYGKSGWSIVYTEGSQVTIPKRNYISFSEDQFCHCKQCRPWWYAASRCISSGSSLLDKVPIYRFLVP